MNLVEIKGLHHAQDDTPVLDVPNWNLRNSGHAVVSGPSGSGKSTLLHILVGLLVPTSGHITVARHDWSALSEVKRDAVRAKTVGIVFQSLHLIDAISVFDNLALAQRLCEDGTDSGYIAQLLDGLGLTSKAAHRPHTLSQGERQRVAIARALVNRPALVLANEPTSALDNSNAEDVITLLKNLSLEYGTAL